MGREEEARLRVALIHHLGKSPFSIEERPPAFQFSAFPAPEAAGDSGGPGPGRVSIERLIPAAAETLGPHPDLELGVVPYLLEPSALPRAGEMSCWVCPEAVSLGQAGGIRVGAGGWGRIEVFFDSWPLQLITPEADWVREGTRS